MLSKLLKGREDIAAEFAGTFLLVLFGAGCIAAGRGNAGLLSIALAHGGALTLGILLFGHISGAFFNPAVTLAAVVAGRRSKAGLGLFMAAQVLGGIAAALVLKLFVPTSSLGETTSSLPLWQAFGVEALLTFLLASVVLGLTARKHPAGGFAPLGIGLTLLAAILLGGPLTGASLNPARSIGPALFEGSEAIKQLFTTYIPATMLGGWAAGLAWKD